MKYAQLRSCFTFLLLFHCSWSFEPVMNTLGIVGGIAISVAYTTWDIIKCRYRECCDDNSIKFNYSGLLSNFKRSVHGQHLAEHIIARALRGHMLNKNPEKALVMSFHGGSGIGKNYVSQFIAQSLYQKGVHSDFVHLYVTTLHFPHKSRVEEYRDKLQKEIKKATVRCQRSLFIFDEVDKMPFGVIDALKPYIDYYKDIEGIDYRKNIFIFLSNSGGSEIAKVALSFWLNGKNRTEIVLNDIEPLINKGAFNEEGGLHFSNIIERSLIDWYVPFLPLEREHVKLCIRDKLRARFKLVTQELINKIVDSVEYYPNDLSIYAESGCKRIEQKIELYTND